MHYFLWKSLEHKTFILCMLNFLYTTGIPQNPNNKRSVPWAPEKLMNEKYFTGKTLVFLGKQSVCFTSILRRMMMTLTGMSFMRSEGRGHVIQVLSHTINSFYIIWRIWNYHYSKFEEFQVQKTYKTRQIACFNTSPASLGIRMAQTMPDSTYLPKNSPEFL